MAARIVSEITAGLIMGIVFGLWILSWGA